jgi:hypothetical protein
MLTVLTEKRAAGEVAAPVVAEAPKKRRGLFGRKQK